ncbi:ATP-grasp domain-containing protein, partial [Rhizobium leguminosarum]|nr:ATP-grasp domain-containing protein [Rhizobium leguminosarum]
MFDTVLVANRGEIAVRVLRTLRRLGIRSVAVHSDADADARHVREADTAVRLGPAPARESYLDIDAVLDVARRAGADAVHPGYGFLSENADFARAVADAGLVWIGPPAEAIDRLGDKVSARQLATKVGAPLAPGTTSPVTGTEEVVAFADEFGLPVAIKAAYGGGGRGMRRVERREDLRGALEAAMREADTAFGDPTVFLEQAVLRPRHIEVQILADGEGNVVHLFERDCSLQRRHQKVIEMAPAPNLDEEIRQALHRDAVAFAKEMGYVNAGTVEFLVDTAGERAGQHVFIEMNPRIQVEHTVTEEVTDVDLVGAQLRIAAGATLPELGITQDALQVRGFAIQCRITTEDPANGFRPDTGTITAYRSAGGSG